MGTGAGIYRLILLLVIYSKNIKAGVTTSTQTRRIAREIYPELELDSDGNQRQVCFLGDLVYSTGEIIPAEQPCLKCKCQPPGVQCETIRCTKKIGCKTIHRPNQCCPDYQCECYHDERIYANGEKIKTTSEEDCKVCYCRGGEIQCTEVSCYIRSDCEAKRLPGQCCPKYDHCPPKDPVSSNHTDNFQGIINIEAADQNKQEITIEEIIPSSAPIEVKETVNGSINNVIVTDSVPDSSEISEVFQPPPVLRIGDKLLFLKEGELVPERNVSASSSVITIIGAEGLQQGFEESFEDATNGTNNLEPVASESTHILSLVKHKGQVSTTATTTLPTEPTEEATTEATTLTEMYIEELITSTIPSRSVESIEEASDDSGENTTPRDNYSSVTSPENASVEDISAAESTDMMLSAEDTEILLNATEAITSKSIGKRENSADDEADEVFKELEAELDSDRTDRTLTTEEEREEAEMIFQELLDETRNPKAKKKGDKDDETIQRITDTIARITLRGRKSSSDGSNVLRLLSDFFVPQNRFDRKK